MSQLKKPKGEAPDHGSASREPLRPPWFRAEAPYTGKCDGCGACIRACPRGLLRAGADGTPEIDFAKGGCDFCGVCVKACARGAFATVYERPPWAYEAEIGEACLAFQGVACEICEAYCQDSAISFRHFAGGFALAEVWSDLCTGCGACVSTCPAGAIAMRRGNGDLH